MEWSLIGPVEHMQPDYVVSSDNKHGGAFGLLMHSKNAHVHGRAVQNVVVQSDQTYTFSAWFYPEQIPSIESVMIRIKWLKGKQNLGYHYVYEVQAKENGWYQAKNTVRALEVRIMQKSRWKCAGALGAYGGMI